MKIYPVGPELFHADGKTNKKKLVVTFRNFAKALITDVVSPIRRSSLFYCVTKAQ